MSQMKASMYQGFIQDFFPGGEGWGVGGGVGNIDVCKWWMSTLVHPLGFVDFNQIRDI